jgi:hypothetical protein
VRRARALEIQDRKSLLAARALVDRAQMTVAVHDIRAAIAPPGSRSRGPFARGAAALLIGLVAPLVGPSKLGRWLRIASYGLAAWRIARNWRQTH